jgi:DinB superfamily
MRIEASAMTPVERERAIAYLEETRERLLQTARGLSLAQLQYKPSSDRWSIAEMVEHVAFVEGRIQAGIKKALGQQATTCERALKDDELVERIVGRTKRMKAPDVVVPTGRWPLDQLFPEFELARKRSIEFARTTDAPLRRHSYPHPFFGELDCYQWLLVIPSHSERHRLQAEEVIAAAGFPGAATA